MPVPAAKQIHSAVADIAEIRHTLERSRLIRNGSVTLREYIGSDNADVVILLPERKAHFFVSEQIFPIGGLLFRYPRKGKPGGDMNVCLGEIFTAQFHSDGSKRKNVVVLIDGLLRRIVLVSLTDKIIFAVIGQHISGEERFSLVGVDTGTETGIRCFHIPVARIHADDFGVVKVFHSLFSSFSPSFRGVVLMDNCKMWEQLS